MNFDPVRVPLYWHEMNVMVFYVYYCDKCCIYFTLLCFLRQTAAAFNFGKFRTTVLVKCHDGSTTRPPMHGVPLRIESKYDFDPPPTPPPTPTLALAAA